MALWCSIRFYCGYVEHRAQVHIFTSKGCEAPMCKPVLAALERLLYIALILKMLPSLALEMIVVSNVTIL